MGKDYDIKGTLKEAVDRIKSLMVLEKWGEAHRACLEVLRVDPENLRVIKIKHKIEKVVKKKNIKAIKEDLKKLKPLWREKNYEELLENLKLLQPYISEYPPLRGIIIKAQKVYEKQISGEQNDYYKEAIKYINDLRKENKFEEAFREAERLKIIKQHENKVKDLIKDIRKHWIDYEIGRSQNLLKSDKYEDIIVFLQGIKRIDPKSKKIQNLIASVKKKYEIYKIEQKKDFIYSTLEKVRTLYQMKKYYKAVEAAEQVIGLVPGNINAQNLYLKSKKKYDAQVEAELIKQMGESYKHINKEAKINKGKYTRI